MSIRVTLIGPPDLPCTDMMIVRGAKNLIRSAVGLEAELVSFSETGEDIKLPEGTTHAIVNGTPYLWDRCWISRKYRSIRQIRRDNPDVKILFLGIGSCYPLGKEDEISASIVKLGATKIKEFFEGTTVTVRDHLILETLTQCGVKAELLVCPAYFASEDAVTGYGYTPHPSLFFYDPHNGISSGCFTKDERDALIKMQFDWARKTGAMVYAVNEHEMHLASSNGFYVELLQTTNHALDRIYRSSEILSGRVHLAVPALSMGKNVELMAVDSRAQTLEYARLANVEEDRKRLVEILKDFLK